MTREEYMARLNSEDDWAPGWDAVEEEFARLYPGKEPAHYGTEIHARAMFGGDNYLDGYSLYDSGKGYQHIVTYGMSELYMNEEAFQKTIDTGKMTYWSRSRNELWVKGLTSGHFQYVKELIVDCDLDTILAKVSQTGAACHTGNPTCFFQPLVGSDYDETNPLQVFESVYNTIVDRRDHPKEGSYTNYLFEKGIDKILKKVGEEATEIIIAAKNPNPEEVKYEMADFLYHAMVLMVERGVSWEDIVKELADR